MKISFFETVRYRAPEALPPEWPVPSGAYDRDAGARAYQEMIERLKYVEELGFDWVSVSEHHYSPRILTPSPIVSAAFIAAHLKRITIALLGPIVPHSNPVRVAEELAMLDTMAQGRLVVGLLRGTANEAMTYDLNPQEARERTDEGMELILKAWTEPQPFGWQGRHFQYRTVSIWPRPLQQPHPPTFALGTSRESCEFAARHHLGLRRVLRAVRGHGQGHAVLPRAVRAPRLAAVTRADRLPGEHARGRDRRGGARAAARAAEPGAVHHARRRPRRRHDARLPQHRGRGASAGVTGALPTTFVGSPDTVVEQVRRCRAVVGAGVLDLSLHPPGSGDLDPLMRALELFGKKVLPRIRDL